MTNRLIPSEGGVAGDRAIRQVNVAVFLDARVLDRQRSMYQSDLLRERLNETVEGWWPRSGAAGPEYLYAVRPLRHSINVTLDGCCDHRAISPDEETHRHATDILAQVDALLFGRVTWRMGTMSRGRMLGLAVGICALGALFSAGSAAAATGEIHGKVTDHLGEPIIGITVCAEGLGLLGGSECDWNTDAEGRYSIGGLQATSYRVGFHVEGSPLLNYVQQWYSGKAHPEEADPVVLAEGESKEINAQLQTGGQIHGTVVDHETDVPIEGVEVCARLLGFFQSGEVGYCGRSDAAGEFTVKNLGTGQYRLELRTEGHVNYIEELLPEPPGSISVTAGAVVEVEARLEPGVEIEGTLTETGTGMPIVGLPAPFTVPAICALNPATQARVKCDVVGSGGHYSIAGLPAGTYAVSFALDWVEEGLDLHPDGYVRRYWHEVPDFGEATLLSGTAGMVFDEIDAALTKGEEVFPNCEVKSACPAPPSSTETSSADSVIISMTTLPQVKPTTPPQARRPRCRKGFHRAKKSGHARCVKISKRHTHR